ncbi:helix-turn-helix domain-containing protein [Novosphingobium sp. TH158]|uniref:winged helix-turn-helix transcriptional regulator n=1 Tax=Novosphingobium sp. TH158 TaxID=2067455 RepID=UPI001570DC58|nr:helix-turn-helix domain-containing protein [Novosphingobium sp. TH158]
MGKLREPLDDQDCGLPLALEAMGERWSFMILRAALNGVHHFEDFLAATGIARNILSNRLGRLVENGILQRQQMEDDRRKVLYRLTDKGMDLLPAMLALRQWGEKYGLGVPSNPVLVDKRDGLPIQPISVLAHDGRVLSHEDLRWFDKADLGKPDQPCVGPSAQDLPGWHEDMIG